MEVAWRFSMRRVRLPAGREAIRSLLAAQFQHDKDQDRAAEAAVKQKVD
jgi:hypothetical protein